MLLSRQVKSALVKAFPGVQFSVKTAKHNSDIIYVRWVLDLGSSATMDAVKSVAGKFETVKNHGDIMNDTHWTTGTAINYQPEYTQERKDWAAKSVEGYYSIKLEFKSGYFVDANGGTNFTAQDRYEEFLRNGVVDNLFDAYGRDSVKKGQYYRELERKQRVQVESAIKEPDNGFKFVKEFNQTDYSAFTHVLRSLEMQYMTKPVFHGNRVRTWELFVPVEHLELCSDPFFFVNGLNPLKEETQLENGCIQVINL